MIIETTLQALQAGQDLELAYGDTLRVTVTFNAIAPTAVTTEVWVSLVIEPGRDYTIKRSVALNKSITPLPYSVVVDMPISDTVGLKNYTYDLWAELPSYNKVVKISGAVTITGVAEDFILIRDTKYPLASTYYGNAERSTITFNVVIPSFMMSSAKVDQMVTNLEDKFVEIGAHMLELKLYERSGLILSSYIAIITTTVPTAASGLSVGPLIFGIDDAVLIAIIIAVCLIIGLVIVLVIRKDVSQFLYGTPEGAPGIMDMIGPIFMLMVLSMLTEFIRGMSAPEEPKPVTEAVVKGVKEVGKGVKYVAEKAAPVVGKIIKRVTKTEEVEEAEA